MSASVATRRTTPRATAPGSPRMVLGIILASYLMIILDASIVITALPEIGGTLHFSQANLSWVQNAYTLAFGGLLLLGARAGDLLGRRRMFLAGIGLFTLASFAAGIASSAEGLLVARALQGVGAAVAAPSTLALLMTSFGEGPERARALGAYSAVAGGGGSVGLVLGGMLTSWVSWRVGMFLNVPLGLALLLLAPRHLAETPRSTGRFDLAGAATSTLGMTAVVYGFVRAAAEGWGDRLTVASFSAGAVLLVLFAVTEARAEQPITPLRLFASRERSGALAARVLVVGGMFSMFFFVTQYLQRVLGFSAVEAGLAFLPQTLMLFGVTRLLPRLATRWSTTQLLVAGIGLGLLGMAWLSRLGVGTDYLTGVALPMVVMGFGMGLAFTPLTQAGIAGVAPGDAGAASGLVNVAHQLGGSLGLSLLVTVFAAAGDGTTNQSRGELAHAIHAALTGSAVFLALAVLVVLVVVRTPALARVPARAAARA